jgi:hypothetical protein
MTCPTCEKRHAQEQRQLADCESRCSEMNLKNKRLTLALAVLGTLVGKETLDYALGLSSTLGGLAALRQESTPTEPEVEVVMEEVEENKISVRPTRSTLRSRDSDIFAALPPLLPRIHAETYGPQSELTFGLFNMDSPVCVPCVGTVTVLGVLAATSKSRKR